MLDKLARIISGAAILIALILLVIWLIPDKPKKYLRTDLMAVQEGDAFYTGFASIGVVRFRANGNMHALKDMTVGDRLEEADGYCYRLYELSIGYPGLRAAVDRAEAASGEEVSIPDPQVLSANVIDARHAGEHVSTSQCDAFDFVDKKRTNEKRLGELQKELIDNGQWESQREHGKKVLITFSKRLTELRKAAAEKRIAALKKEQGALSASQDPAALELALQQEEIDFARAGGYLGALRLTFATLGIFSQDEGRWFWKRNAFYVRQDLAEATYGTDFARHVATVKGGWFSPRRLVITVPEPRLLALDRYSTLQVTRQAKPFTLKNDPRGDGIETAMRADLEKFMRSLSPQAIRFAKSALTAQMLSLAGEDVTDVEVKFERDEAETPSQLAELIAGLQRERLEKAAKED